MKYGADVLARRLAWLVDQGPVRNRMSVRRTGLLDSIDEPRDREVQTSQPTRHANFLRRYGPTVRRARDPDDHPLLRKPKDRVLAQSDQLGAPRVQPDRIAGCRQQHRRAPGG